MFICNVSEINYLHSHSILYRFSNFHIQAPKTSVMTNLFAKGSRLGLGNVNIEIGTGSREKYRYHRINTPEFDSTVV